MRNKNTDYNLRFLVIHTHVQTVYTRPQGIEASSGHVHAELVATYVRVRTSCFYVEFKFFIAHTNIYLGTIFLWMYWPSFNGALASGNAQYRAVINTYYSMTGSVLSTFIFSMLFNKSRKLDMVCYKYQYRQCTLFWKLLYAISHQNCVEHFFRGIKGMCPGHNLWPQRQHSNVCKELLFLSRFFSRSNSVESSKSSMQTLY